MLPQEEPYDSLKSEGDGVVMCISSQPAAFCTPSASSKVAVSYLVSAHACTTFFSSKKSPPARAVTKFVFTPLQVTDEGDAINAPGGNDGVCLPLLTNLSRLPSLPLPLILSKAPSSSLKYPSLQPPSKSERRRKGREGSEMAKQLQDGNGQHGTRPHEDPIKQSSPTPPPANVFRGVGKEAVSAHDPSRVDVDAVALTLA